MVATRLAKGSVVAYKHAHLVSFVMQLTCAIQAFIPPQLKHQLSAFQA